MRECYEQLYTDKFDNLHGIDKFLEMQNYQIYLRTSR